MLLVFVSIESFTNVRLPAAHVGVIVPVVTTRPLAAVPVTLTVETAVQLGASTVAVETQAHDGVRIAAWVESVERDSIE
jgi:hypothetical protein